MNIKNLKIIFSSLILILFLYGCDETSSSGDDENLPPIDNKGMVSTNITYDAPKLNKPVTFSAKDGNSFSWEIVDSDGLSIPLGDKKDVVYTFEKGGEWTVILRSDIGESKGIITIPNDNADINYNIDLGASHSIIGNISSNDLYVYGSNTKGKLCVDENDYKNISTPHLLVSFRDLDSTANKNQTDAVAAGDNHTLFVSNHRVWGCGDNKYGQLGLGSNGPESSSEPIHISNIKYGKQIALYVGAGGDKSTAIIRTIQSGNGVLSKVYSFGVEESYENPTLLPREMVVPNVAGRECPIQAVGRQHMLFRATWAFNMFSGGWNNKGQLGRAANRTAGYGGSSPDEIIVDEKAWGYSDMTAYIYSPYGEGYDPEWEGIPGGTSNITYFENNNCDARLAAGDYFSMAVKRASTDALYIWGDNSEGQIGVDTTSRIIDNLIRRPAPLFNNLESKDETYKNSMGTFITSTPIRAKILEIAAGRAHGLAVDDKGVLYAWGSNGKNQLTNIGKTNATNNRVVEIPVPNGATKWLNVWAGGDRTIALADDYNLYTWGDNKDGILGIGSDENTISAPIKLTFDIRPVEESIEQ